MVNQSPDRRGLGRSKHRIIPAKPSIHEVRRAVQSREVPEVRGIEARQAIEQWREKIKRAEAMREMVRRAAEQLKQIQARTPKTRREAEEITAEYRRVTEDMLRFQMAFGHALGQAEDVAGTVNGSHSGVQARYTEHYKGDKHKVGDPVLDREGNPVMVRPFDVVHMAHVEEKRDFQTFLKTWEEMGLVEAAIASYQSPVVHYDEGGRSDREMERMALAEGAVTSMFSEGADGEPAATLRDLADDFVPEPGEAGENDIETNALLDLRRYMSEEEAAALAPALQEVMHGVDAMPANVAAFYESLVDDIQDDDPMPSDPGEKKRWYARQRQDGRRKKISDYWRLPLSELTAKREELSVQAHKLYARREIRARWTEKTFQRLILDAKSGADILEIPQVREIVGKLHRWEREHPNSIVGAALVGPPGTGKSTGVEYYLEKMGRPEPIRMDVSQELTRYALFGSPEVQFESDIDRYRKLAERVGSLSEADVLSMVQKHADKLGAALGDMNPEERSVIALASLKEEVDEILRAGGEMDTDAHAKVQALRGALEGLANGQYQSELATQLADITHKNGWRDGMIIHALRHQRPLIIDEFNAAKSWTLLNKLLTSKPGEDYFFADNNESIKIPDWYRIYFTANIGGKYGRFKVQEDLMSRFGKRVIEVDYPPAEDEFMVMVAFVCNAYTEMLRDKVDMYKLGTFVRTVVPKLRAAMNESKQASNPISFRTYREIGETLVTPGPAGTERKSNSVDKAVLESVVNPFAGWEDRTLAKTLVQLMLESDLLLDDESVWPEVTRWTGISHEELQQKKDDMDTDKRRAAADQLLDGAQQAFAARMMASGQGL